MITIISAIGVLVLALAHLFVNKLKISYIPRSKWLSTAGGISVAYIFVHILPEMAEYQSHISDKDELSHLPFLEHAVYFIALLGLTLYYGLERAAKKSAESHRSMEGNNGNEDAQVFWSHMLSFGAYNFLIGYLLLQRESEDIKGLIFFIIAMAFHFIVNDFGLVDHYRMMYLKKGRWIIILPLILGWITALLIELPKTYIGLMFAFVGGSVILNILKEELPEERKSNFWAFLLGVLAYTTLLIVL